MSSDVIARVDAFARKADELTEKGHLLRAAEYFGRAAEAARVLGADNLVTVHILLRKCNLLGVWAWAALGATADPLVLAGYRAECTTLLSGAVETLERRRLAGTLLDGKCDAAEEAWQTAVLQRSIEDRRPAVVANLAALVGYEQFMRAAKNASEVLAGAVLYARECSDAQFQSFAQHVVHAADMVQQPRPLGDDGIEIEAKFIEKLRFAAANRRFPNQGSRLILSGLI